VLFLDAIYLPVRPSGPKEGVICAWGITENGDRALVSVRLGMREGKEDWLELGRDLTARGLAAPRLVVTDGAPGLISAVEEIWPRADRQHCAVHRLRTSRRDRSGVRPTTPNDVGRACRVVRSEATRLECLGVDQQWRGNSNTPPNHRPLRSACGPATSM
jgi:hypothetical protein